MLLTVLLSVVLLLPVALLLSVLLLYACVLIVLLIFAALCQRGEPGRAQRLRVAQQLVVELGVALTVTGIGSA